MPVVTLLFAVALLSIAPSHAQSHEAVALVELAGIEIPGLEGVDVDTPTIGDGW